MKRKTILRITAAFLLSCTVLACGTACESSKESEETEEEIEETSEVKTPETSAEPSETSAVVTETVVETETEAAADTSADDDRFRAFFENQYPNLNESMMFDINGINVLYAYYDLDRDSINELLIGDVEGVYAVVSEADGQYHVTEFNGWRTQYGPEPCEYIGNGCFLTPIYNGNNYGGEFCTDVLWRYDSSTEVGRVVIARLSGSWDPTNFTENLSKWELYVAIDENASLAENSDGFTPDFPNYTYSMIDFGDNYRFENGERVYNEIETEFYAYVDAHREADPMTALTWHAVSDFI